MHSSVYLKHYRLPEAVGDSPREGTFKATDSRSGAPVSLTLIPIASIPEEEREEFEKRARALKQFDHSNVARLVAFGREDDVYAFVSESPRGETAAEWVSQYGRMPPEAVLRIGIQIVSAAGAAAFQQIFHRAINPSNLIILPGQMAEGGWPAIKLVNLVSDGFARASGGVAGDVQFASPELLQEGKVDFRSEIYSLGATMAYLLTGAFYSAEPKSLQTRRFARPLRKLLRPMLRQNPEERPHDPVMLADALRFCLETVERRLLLAQRFGIPFFAVRTREAPKPRVRWSKPPRPVLAHMGESGLASAEPPPPVVEPDEIPSSPWRIWAVRTATAVAIVLGLGLFAAALMPGRALALFQGQHAVKEIGVAEPAPVWEGKPLVLNKNRIPVATNAGTTSPAEGLGKSEPVVSPASKSLGSNDSGAVAANSSHDAPSPAVAESGSNEPSSPAEGPQTVWEKAGSRPLNERIASSEAVSSATPASAEARDEASKPSEAAESSESTQSTPNADDESPRTRHVPQNPDANTRSRPDSLNTNRRIVKTGHGMARMASDGSVILRLPDGTIAVIPPTQVEYSPRRTHPRRRVIQREPVYSGYPYYGPRD